MTLETNKLEITLDGETDIIVQRHFSHPPSRVWQGLTEPALIRQWMASQDDMKRCEIDARSGGFFLYEWEGFTFSGEVLEADSPHRMVHVEHFSEDKTYRAEITTNLVAFGTGTSMTQVMRYANKEARAAAIKIGFTDGLGDVYDRLDALIVVK